MYNFNMLVDKNKIVDMFKNFIETCNENDIWFSLDNVALLGAKRHAGFVPWHEKIEVMITVEGYNKLKRLFPENILDSSLDAGFKSLTIAWVENNKKWKEKQAFIQIRLAIPTTFEKFKQFKSSKYSVLRKFSGKKDNIKRAINDLYSPQKFEGYLVLENRKSPIEKNWIQVITYKTETLPFLGLDVPVLKEYKTVLEDWFGKGYMKAVVPTSWYEYPYPLKEIEVN